jgi:hypothetical protein
VIRDFGTLNCALPYRSGASIAVYRRNAGRGHDRTDAHLAAGRDARRRDFDHGHLLPVAPTAAILRPLTDKGWTGMALNTKRFRLRYERAASAVLQASVHIDEEIASDVVK